MSHKRDLFTKHSRLSLSFQEQLSQATEALDDMLQSFDSKSAAEQTAVAALTALRNNNNNNHTTKTVTSVLSKTHLQNLEANSVSVIPIDTLSKQQQQQQQQQPNNSVINATFHQKVTTNQSQPPPPPQLLPVNAAALHQQKLSQLQQQLETAAVLMDISKKVIISPPSSNPQSPSVGESQKQQHNSHPQSITTNVIKVSSCPWFVTQYQVVIIYFFPLESGLHYQQRLHQTFIKYRRNGPLRQTHQVGTSLS